MIHKKIRAPQIIYNFSLTNILTKLQPVSLVLCPDPLLMTIVVVCLLWCLVTLVTVQYSSTNSIISSPN